MKLLGFYSKPVQKEPEFTPRRRRRRNWRPLIVIVILLLLLGILIWALTAAVTSLMSWWNSRTTDAVELEYIGDIPVYEEYMPEDSPGRPGEKRLVEWIVIHETDNFSPTADAAAHAAFLCSLGPDDEPRSWHYTVDDHQIYHHLPDDEAAYHASDKLTPHGGNLNGIGIEMCVNEGGDYEQTLENTVQLTAKLMIEYGLKIRDVQTHQHFSSWDKPCPAKLLESDRWEEFLDRVEDARKEALEAQREAERRAKEREDSILPGFLYDLLHKDDEDK